MRSLGNQGFIHNRKYIEKEENKRDTWKEFLLCVSPFDFSRHTGDRKLKSFFESLLEMFFVASLVSIFLSDSTA